jgi:tetratricopeptide (TPR) repeat protein
MSIRNLVLFTLFTSVALVLACGPSEEEAATTARADEWAAIQSDRAALTDLRAQLEAARERTEAAGEAPAAAASQGAPPAADVQAGAPEAPETAAPPQAPETAEEQQLQTKVDEATDRFLERLVTFINENAGFQGEAPPPEVAEAIRTKSAEDLLLAKEYIERGGDYAKAIDILESAKVVDPGNPDLEAALAEAQRFRYMDEERFSRVEKGMTESEVRRELGQVKHQNVRQYEDGKVIAWFYPKEGGAAAAIFFRPKDDELLVYDTNFNAVESAAERAGEAGAAEGSAAD